MSHRLQVKMVSYDAADEAIRANGLDKLNKLLGADSFELTDRNPDVVFFMSGGSEKEAIRSLREGKYYMLLAHNEANAYAAATEVKAFMDQHNMRSVIIAADMPDAGDAIKKYSQAIKAIKSLQGKKIGLIGGVSEWLVASNPEAYIIRDKLGIEIVRYQWKDLPSLNKKGVSEEFMKAFALEPSEKNNDSSRVYSLLKDWIEDHGLNAITTECFSLVKKTEATACLALSLLNQENIPAGCEGDIVSITGMTVMKELIGKAPWMANISGLTDQEVSFSHCSIPLNMLKSFEITSHYETGQGTAIDGALEGKSYTVFRFDQNFRKMFLTKAKLKSQSSGGAHCRTLVSLAMSAGALHELKEHPLGNHHLIIRGDHTKILKEFALIKGIEIIP